MFLLCLMIHWITNSDECSLTLLENILRGVEKNETFTYQFIGPIYNIINTEWNKIIWILTIILLLISLKKIYKSKIIYNVYHEYKKSKNINVLKFLFIY